LLRKSPDSIDGKILSGSSRRFGKPKNKSTAFSFYWATTPSTIQNRMSSWKPSKARYERVIVLTVDDPTLVNAVQRRAAVILQKSTREGFGLTVTEAMWKGAAVIGGNVGGIKKQITNGENGFLVDSVEQASDRIVELLKNPQLRERLGQRAKETVRENYLLCHLVEDWIDVVAGLDRCPKEQQLQQRP
jgi:glycosyltransferase involved in cell wall biosynthesis